MMVAVAAATKYRSQKILAPNDERAHDHSRQSTGFTSSDGAGSHTGRAKANRRSLANRVILRDRGRAGLRMTRGSAATVISTKTMATKAAPTAKSMASVSVAGPVPFVRLTRSMSGFARAIQAARSCASNNQSDPSSQAPHNAYAQTRAMNTCFDQRETATVIATQIRIDPIVTISMAAISSGSTPHQESRSRPSGPGRARYRFPASNRRQTSPRRCAGGLSR